ncbi:MAG: guanine deaminase, partial [Bryobacteraceae bacterium]
MPRPDELLRARVLHTPRNPFAAADACESFDDGGLLVSAGRIRAVGDYAALQSAHPNAETRDLRGGLLLPGFVDAHTHFP